MIRFYLSLLKSYIEESKKFSEVLINVWINEIKPYILKSYPISLRGSFNANSDLQFLSAIIDNLRETYSPTEKKGEIKNKKNNDKKEEEEIKDINILRKKNLPKITKFLEEFIEKNDLDIKRSNSMINLRHHSQTIGSATTCEDSIYNDDTIINANQLKNNNKEINIVYRKSCTKNSFAEFAEMLNQNLKDKKEKEEKQKETKIKDSKSNQIKLKETISKQIIKETKSNVINLDEEKSKEFNIKNIIGSSNNKPLVLTREMIPKYMDEEVNEKNLIYKEINNNKKLSYILTDLLLKKIIFDDFINQNVLLMYHFFQQCYCFINKEIFIRKIIDCYKYYKNKNVSYDQLQNLVEFVNIFVIVMFDYYEKIDFKQVHFKFIKSFYNELIVDLLNDFKDNGIKSKKAYNKINEVNNQEAFRFESFDQLFDQIEDYEKQKNTPNNRSHKLINKDNNKYRNIELDRENIINMNLNMEIKKINIFIIQEIEKLSVEEKGTNSGEKNNTNKSKDKSDSYSEMRKSNERNSISFSHSIFTMPRPELNEDRDLKSEGRKNSFLISKTLRHSKIMKLKNEIISIAEIPEEENIKEKSGDEDDKLNKSNNSTNSLMSCKSNQSDSSDEENNNNKTKVFRTKEEEIEENEKDEILKDMVKEVFLNQSIISSKEKILQKLEFILPLIDPNDYEDISPIDIHDAKSNIPFFNMVKNLLNQANDNKISLYDTQSKGVSKFARKTLSYQTPSIYKKEICKKDYFHIRDWKSEEIGNKLTQVTISLLNKINRREIYKGIFLKKDKDITSPNVVNCINNFNKLTSFVIEDVISYDTPKIRAKIYGKWVITGLKLTLKNISSKAKNLFEKISNFCSVEGNYKKIRDDMNLCEKEGINFVPYLGMLLRDINFYEENAKYINENGCINMGKIETINALFEKYFRYKHDKKYLQMIYQNSHNNIFDSLKFFEQLEDIPETKLEEISNNIEPIFQYGSVTSKRKTNIDIKFFQNNIDPKKKDFNKLVKLRSTLIPIRSKPFEPNQFFK